jgi:hypothetical protein
MNDLPPDLLSPVITCVERAGDMPGLAIVHEGASVSRSSASGNMRQGRTCTTRLDEAAGAGWRRRAPMNAASWLPGDEQIPEEECA